MGMSTSSPRILQGTARNRVVVAYAVAPGQVAPLLPEGLVPDQRDGNAYVSLVGVELTKVRVLGLIPPGFRRVPAVELRVHARPAQAPLQEAGTWTVQEALEQEIPLPLIYQALAERFGSRAPDAGRFSRRLANRLRYGFGRHEVARREK